jgi:hypothetical protein
MKPILFIFLIFCSLYGFTQTDSTENHLTYNYFKTHLTKEMDHKKIIQTFGQPNKDIGSGIFIYEYDLNDSTKITIGCVDRVHYSYHTDSNDKLLHTLIENEK